MFLRLLGLTAALLLAIYGLAGPDRLASLVKNNETSPAASTHFTVAVAKLNLRIAASTTSAIIGELEMGDQVLILEAAESGWVRVSHANSNRIGWVKRSFLK
jgi:uncharacterized protein YgiM (DUF1202 family)